ncbi:cytidyltransferase-like protein [Kribbella sp. VKM Ac-2568]|nr:cytidyltransferase-like protein [Kribbella sp. VKM Ac-2568]
MRSPAERPTAGRARRAVSARYKVSADVGGHVGRWWGPVVRVFTGSSSRKESPWGRRRVREDSQGEQKVPQRIGYLTGVFDLFHVGHLDVLERAREKCDRLVVGVLTDDWAVDAWGARPFVPLVERAQILEQLRCVDEVVVVEGVQPEWLIGVLGVRTVFAASGTDGVLGADELDGIPAGLVSTLPAGRGSSSQILRAAIDQRQSRSSVA